MVGSDGWTAIYLPSYDGDFKSMSALAQTDKCINLENGLLDKYSGVVYLKIKGGQFEVVYFSSSISAMTMCLLLIMIIGIVPMLNIQ